MTNSLFDLKFYGKTGTGKNTVCMIGYFKLESDFIILGAFKCLTHDLRDEYILKVKNYIENNGFQNIDELF